MMMQSKRRVVTAVTLAMCFAFFTVFFTKIHPIVLFDTDSWYYAYYHRHAWPIWHFWNPTRVFPEVFMPAVSQFSAHVIYPVTGDYFFSLTIGYAVSVSAAVTLLTWMVMRHFQREGSSPLESVGITLLFLICHFLILRSEDNFNRYMLLTENTCTHFYYVIPNLLNCTLVLWVADDPELRRFFSKGYSMRKAFFLLLAYFCAFSNLWASMIGGIYAGVALLIALIATKKDKKSWLRDTLKENSGLLLLLALWALAQLFEFNGRRAAQIKNLNFSETVQTTLAAAKPVLFSVSHTFRWMAAILLVGGIGITLWKKRWNETASVLWALIAVPFTAIYLLLSCAVCAPGYITRPDTFYGLFFFGMLILLVLFRQIIRHLPRIRIVVPLLLVILAFECNTADVTYRNSMYFNLPAQTCYKVDNDILRQLQGAVEAGKKKTVLYVPQFDVEKNWPLATYANKRIPLHLYKMGLLERNIKVKEIIPTKDKNEEFHID